MLYHKLKRSVELAGKSQSTLTNYARCLAHIALHFNCSPLELDEEQILDYLHVLKSQHKTPSDSFFKHTVYGLRKELGKSQPASFYESLFKNQWVVYCKRPFFGPS
ncbi:phage integrase N-terminal SAM-like domain-containing protein [Oceanihabitans sp. IOP_32]|uniref:phage integrase N-terminal SAM-like domain-containing protein n=1 Tax=Oceanihabitans sp. IOP_32 TaxID=2529032 RepID=UPI001D176217|nr:phage integrase N-terminal SAM-like domain-containing protein [Oceanihabitans sp. IOP_32]